MSEENKKTKEGSEEEVVVKTKKATKTVPADTGYGFADDESTGMSFNFGLIPALTFLKKFEWIPNGGSGGAEQEALEVIFEINGTEKSYRKFPVTQAFGENDTKVTDPSAPEMIEARKNLSSCLVHILGCFVPKEDIKVALSKPLEGFKDFCNVFMGLLPNDFDKVSLDIFMQWQWRPSKDKNQTYLEIPNKMKHGRWLAKAVVADGQWLEKKVKDPTDKVRKALWFVDSENEENIHPFTRTGWYMNHPNAHQIKEGVDSQDALSEAAEHVNDDSIEEVFKEENEKTETETEEDEW